MRSERTAPFLPGILAAILLVAAGCGRAPEPGAVAAVASTHTVLPLRHARTFTVEEGAGYRVVTLRASIVSWGAAAGGQEQTARLILVPREATLPALPPDLAGAPIIRTPVRRVAVNYTSHEAMLNVLGVADRLVAVGGTFSYDDAIHARVKSGELAQVGYGWHSPPVMDALVAARPEVFLMALGDISHAESIPRLQALGIPVVPMFVEAEPTCLGRTEYVRLVGLLTGREAEAEHFVAEVDSEYARLKALAATQPRQRLLWAWPGAGDKWAVTVRNADAHQIHDAHAELLLGESDDLRRDNFSWLSTEALLRQGTEADVWVSGDPHSKAYPDERVLRRFKAWREGRVFAVTGRQKRERDAYEIYEIGILRPDYLLGDIIKALHPELRPEPFRYLEPVRTVASSP
ncbi:Periplasmic binding protein [Lacunisphaera limnophila]|uniref:Periplasmic binding protein n=1 Tax=Lacunisphaera limnophila TaxID=1838286 RepID=A0A1D8ASJ3_9BACT|nr:ABC transporter substrate-binding protein [Lacunisphaera limnophila]AOS43832.1 Periplasmic binding protein [Lacunisphaera limnophila]